MLSVKVSVFAYAPVRSASLAPIDCVKRTCTRSLATGAAHRVRVSGAPLRVPGPADVPAGRIYSAADMFTDPQFVARQMIQRFKLADGTDIPLPNITPKLSDTPGETRWLGPELGEHTDEVLRGLGYDAQAIAALRDAGAI